MDLIKKSMYTQSGCSYLDMNTTGKDVVRQNESYIQSLMEELLISRPASDVITLADYGTADAGAILPLMNKLIGTIRGIKGPKQEINVVFEDQRYNDFNKLVKNVTGENHLEGFQTSDNVFVLVSATSMYEQCLQSNSLDFGSCVYALHWLSDCKLTIIDNIFIQPENSDQFSVYETQAKRDWKDFVLKRGKELKAGGIFFLSCLLSESTDKHDYLLDIYRKMLKEDIITKEEFENTNTTFFVNRNEHDLISIFADNDVDSEVKHLGLKLISSEVYDREYWPFTLGVDVAGNFQVARAAALTNIVKSWLYNSIHSGLSEDRTPTKRASIVQCFFDRLERKIFKDGSNFLYINKTADIVFQKQ